MQFDYPLASIPPEDEALRPRIQAFIRDHLPRYPAEVRAKSWMGFDAQFSRDMGQAGWIGLSFPHAYGGQGRGPFARFVVVEELLAAGMPVSAHWIADRQSGPLLLKYGSEEQRRTYVPAICKGEAFFCIGMSEPDSGSDLASVRTRARRVEGGWRLDGRKVWTTNAHRSHYMIALVRTSGGPEDRQKGLSQFIIDLKKPGVTVRPIRDLTGDEHFNEVLFEDVFLEDGTMVGDEGDGWKQCTAELAFERSGPERILSSIVLLDLLAAHIGRHGDAAARHDLGRVTAKMTALRGMSLSITGRLDAGEEPVVEAAMMKEIGTSLEQFIPDLALRHLPDDEVTDFAREAARVLTYNTQMAPSFSLRGGTREILRGMIARGLGLR